MKLAVYCITLNESKFVDRMMNSIIDDADEIVICDTGSTDNTVAMIETWVNKFPEKVKLFHIHIKPWRFDMARNASLALVSKDADVCLCLDLDEIMVRGWRQEIEKVWVPGETTRASYHYVWSWKDDGTPDVAFSTDKLHSRHGYDWYHPVHETLRSYLIEEKRVKTGAVMHHYPDSEKSRGQYLGLLELSVQEAPQDDRNSYYLGREYYFHGQYQKAIDQFERYRALPTAVWHAERGSSWRLAGRCYTSIGKTDQAVECFKKASEECPGMRESWTELAECYYHRQEWQPCLEACLKALTITEVPDVYITEMAAYGAKAHDLLCVAAWALGHYDLAIEQGQKALEHEPFNDRFKKNVEVMLAAKAAMDAQKPQSQSPLAAVF